MSEDRRCFEKHPHPAYGPCDAFGGDGEWCSCCADARWRAEDERDALAAEVARLREADAIVRDMLADDHWRHPRGDIYPRMIAYARAASAPRNWGTADHCHCTPEIRRDCLNGLCLNHPSRAALAERPEGAPE